MKRRKEKKDNQSAGAVAGGGQCVAGEDGSHTPSPNRKSTYIPTLQYAAGEQSARSPESGVHKRKKKRPSFVEDHIPLEGFALFHTTRHILSHMIYSIFCEAGK
eukprot:TRINITY_DN15123_c0_g2_i1.p2 TRINITY_DN15123_c0_g2~~TRINITY_DN15123_c0_g2_i1.p2  ORF type:complete len:104 (-),score=12.47 TRINITY_DN15123_c0_g2_i1:521-832(-)